MPHNLLGRENDLDRALFPHSRLAPLHLFDWTGGKIRECVATAAVPEVQSVFQNAEGRVPDSAMVETRWNLFNGEQGPACEGGLISELSAGLPRIPVLRNVGVVKLEVLQVALGCPETSRPQDQASSTVKASETTPDTTYGPRLVELRCEKCQMVAIPGQFLCHSCGQRLKAGHRESARLKLKAKRSAQAAMIAELRVLTSDIIAANLSQAAGRGQRAKKNVERATKADKRG